MIKLYRHSIGYLQYHCFSLWVLSICCNVWLSSSAQQLWWHIDSRVMRMYLHSQVHQLMLKHWERKENYIFQGILQNISCCLYFANVAWTISYVACQFVYSKNANCFAWNVHENQVTQHADSHAHECLLWWINTQFFSIDEADKFSDQWSYKWWDRNFGNVCIV